MNVKTLLIAAIGILYLSIQPCLANQNGQLILQVKAQPVSELPELASVPTILLDPIPSSVATSSLTTTLSSSGAWSNNGSGPTLYSKNVYYSLALYPVGSIPANATITSVSWSYGVSYRPTGFQALLCNYNGGSLYCGDITSYGSGYTNSFFTGLSANQPMIYYFIVNGTGTLYPYVYGQNDTITVNWTAP